MIESSELLKIKESIEELLAKMTIPSFDVKVETNSIKDAAGTQKDVVDLNINVDEPQVLIGHQGQTLFEFSRLLRIVLNKKLQKDFYLNVDINDYKKKKVEYLKDMARDLAEQVITTKEEKILPPMPSYERRIIHAELAGRQDVATESRGEGAERCIVIKPGI